MDDIAQLMLALDGADTATILRLAHERGSLPVRLAMLGLATARQEDGPLWWGYPPGVFIGYKWDTGATIEGRVRRLAAYVRDRGYRAYLDREHLSADADAYVQIPGYIATLVACRFYVLLLTASAADRVDARDHKTTWIHDELQLAFRRVNAGRLIVVPVLLEPDGLIDALRGAPCIDLTAGDAGFTALDAVLTPDPLRLDDERTAALGRAMAAFDARFLASQWDAAANALARADAFAPAFDHALRRMLLALYTADGPSFEDAFDRLCAGYGRRLVMHVYRGYCARHGIPVRIADRDA